MQFNCDRNRLASIFSVLLISSLIHVIGFVGCWVLGVGGWWGGGEVLQCAMISYWTRLMLNCELKNNELKTNPKPLSQWDHISNGKQADRICFLSFVNITTLNSWWGSWWHTQTVLIYRFRMGVSVCCKPPPSPPTPTSVRTDGWCRF